MKRFLPAFALLLVGICLGGAGLALAALAGVVNISLPANTSARPSRSTARMPVAKSHPRPVNTEHKKAVTAPSASAEVNARLRGMTTQQKVGQMIVVTRHDYTPTVASQFHPGGVIYFNPDLDPRSPVEVAQLSKLMQQRASETGSNLPLLIATDQEYGNVNRLKQTTRLPGNMALGATGDPKLAQKAAKLGGTELKAMGINLNLAPVGDVNYNPANPVIGERSFGDNPKAVAHMASAAVTGYQEAGIGATLKHFPGHGNTATDSHTGLPVISGSADRFKQMNLPPFRAAAPSVDAIMTAHISVPALDNSGLPATLSPKILRILRKDLGFKGVVITDSLGMAGVRKVIPRGSSQPLTDAQTAVMAVKAGVDILLMPPDVRVAYNAILAAVKSGDISMKRLNDSVQRIIRLKLKVTAKKAGASDLANVASARSQKLASQMAAKAVTVIKPSSGFVPIKPSQKVLVTGYGESSPAVMGTFIPNSTVMPLGDHIAAADSDNAFEISKSFPVVVVITYGTQGVDLAKRLIKAGRQVYVVPTGTPGYVSGIIGARSIVTDYGYQALNLSAVANVLTGRTRASGNVPVRLH